MIIGHVAVWVRDLDRMRAFYTEAFGGVSGDLYENPATGFKSYFVSLGQGARLELMHLDYACHRSTRRWALPTLPWLWAVAMRSMSR
jgi:lactoylglutathione lyase